MEYNDYMNTMTETWFPIPNKLANLVRDQLAQYTDTTEEYFEVLDKEITDRDSFDITIDSSSQEVSTDPNHPGTYSFFAHGKCAYLAYRIHLLTSLPLAVWTNGDSDSWTGHVAVKVGEGEYLDIEGVVSNEIICKRYYWNDKTPQVFTDFTHVNDLIGYMPTHYSNLDDLEAELIDYLAKRLIANNGL